jgi:hypothetical protein
MRRTLGALALAALLAVGTGGCGSDDTGATDDAGKVLASPETTKVTQVAIVTGTAAGGRVTTEPTLLPDEDAVRTYAEQFRNDRFQGELVSEAAAADVPDGEQLAAAVVAVGCEVPSGVVGTTTGDHVSVQAVLPSPDKQCLAPITSVALVTLPG